MSVFKKSQPLRCAYVTVIFALALLVASCSFKTLYNQLDYLIPSYVEGMVSLDGLLEEKVEQRTLVLISWHRTTQLNQYANWLRTLQDDIKQPLSEARMLQHIATLESFWQSLSKRINEEMTLLLPQLNAEQRRELFESIADKNEDFYDDYVDVGNDERIERYIGRMFDNYEKWLGDLTDEQETVVKQAATEMITSAELRLERRRHWQRGIQGVLDSGDDEEIKARHLREFFAEFDNRDYAEMKAVEDTNRTVLARLTVQIVNTMSEEQKDHFMSETNDYIRMFTELAEER
jgi:hypothetical protein